MTAVRQGRPPRATADLVAAMRDLGDAATTDALAARLGVTRATVLARLRRAAAEGAVVRTDEGYGLPVQS